MKLTGTKVWILQVKPQGSDEWESSDIDGYWLYGDEQEALDEAVAYNRMLRDDGKWPDIKYRVKSIDLAHYL